MTGRHYVHEGEFALSGHDKLAFIALKGRVWHAIEQVPRDGLGRHPDWIHRAAWNGLIEYHESLLLMETMGHWDSVRLELAREKDWLPAPDE